MLKSNWVSDDELDQRILKESDPSGKPLKEPGAKADEGKSPIVRGCLQYFPRAIKMVADISLRGASKYSWKGWESVPDGEVRYADALGRHIIDEAIDGPIDRDTGCLHKGQVAWNALAALELYLRSLEKGK